jgi:hypothetical protein
VDGIRRLLGAGGRRIGSPQPHYRPRSAAGRGGNGQRSSGLRRLNNDRWVGIFDRWVGIFDRGSRYFDGRGPEWIRRSGGLSGIVALPGCFAGRDEQPGPDDDHGTNPRPDDHDRAVSHHFTLTG